MINNISDPVDSISTCSEYAIIICANGHKLQLVTSEDVAVKVRNVPTYTISKVVIGNGVHLALAEDGE